MKTTHRSKCFLAAVSLAGFVCTHHVAHAATLTWDAGNTANGATIDPLSGAWNLTAGNIVWNDGATPNVIWSQTSTTDGSNAATFAGADGTLDQYVVTLGAQMAAESITFNSSGYQITGSTLALMPTTTTNGAITVAAGKTATINSIIGYANNAVANITVNSGAVLNLGGGASNSQYNFLGTGGTINMTAGTYTANIGKVSIPTFNQSGGTFNITPGVLVGGNGYSIGQAAGQSVNYTLSGTGTLTVNGNASTATVLNSFLALGRAAGNTAYQNTLTVQTGGTVSIGTTASRAGELRIGYDNTSSGKLDVQGGAVTIGTGDTANKIYFFKGGSGAGYSAAMTQSGGTVTANGIQFGGDTGTYDAASSATLTLSGGSLYVGAQGITRGSAAGALPTTIKLQGGTLGANQNWTSDLNMQLGTTATIRAQNSASTARNITLSGVLSDDSGAGTLTKTGAGTLTLSGANTYTGATAVNAGTLVLGNPSAASSSSALTVADTAALSLTTTPSTVKTLTFTNNGTLNYDLAGGGTTLTVDTSDGVTNSGAAGSVTINITGSVPANGTYTLISYSGALQGSGFSAYKLGSTPAGKSYTLQNSANAVQLVVASAFSWTGAFSSEWSTNLITSPKNWNFDGVATDYTNGTVVLFDDTATNKIVDITGADVTPESVLFNSGVYTLQGSHKIAGPAPITVAAAATLKLGTSNVLPDGVGVGNLTINGTLDLNGNSDTINGLSGTGSVDNTAPSTTSTLTVGAIAGGSNTGTLKNTGGTLALTKTGNTDFTLGGTNTYSGATTVSQNRLFISSSAALSPNTAVTVNNGTTFVLNASGTPTFAQSITLASGSNLSARQAATCSNVTLPAAGSVKLNNDDAVTSAVTLSSANALSGALTVQVGGGATPGIVTLSGILSGSGGSLVKTGAGQLALSGDNTFTGGVTIKNGTLEGKTTTTTLGTGTVTMGGTGSTGATFITGKNNSNAFVINAPDSGALVIGANGNGSGFIMSGAVTLNGNLTLQTYDNPVPTPPATTKAVSNLTGGVTGTGNLLLNNLGLAANTITISAATVNHAGSITLQGTATGDTTISAAIGSNVTGITQNSATSPLILSGANTYPGNLTVNAGLVRLSNAPDPLNANTGNDASTVTIAATGATLDLTYTGTDKVAQLVIGSTPLANGVYGKVGSTLPVIGISQITGDGTLTVGSGGGLTFADWKTANGAGSQTLSDDHDGDGVSNGVEFFLGGDTNTTGFTALPAVVKALDGTLSVTWIKHANYPGQYPDDFVVETSTTLGSWTPEPNPPGSVTISGNNVTYTFPGGPAYTGKKFARLVVTGP